MEGVLQEVRQVAEKEELDDSLLALRLMPLEKMRDSVRRQEQETCAQGALNVAARLERDFDIHGAKAARMISELIRQREAKGDSV